MQQSGSLWIYSKCYFKMKNKLQETARNGYGSVAEKQLQLASFICKKTDISYDLFLKLALKMFTRNMLEMITDRTVNRVNSYTGILSHEVSITSHRDA